MNSVLIIEDDVTLLEGLEDAYRFHEFTVFSAGEGNEGLRLHERHRPDLIILDIMLPGRDGFEVCKKIRAGDPETPILILTAMDKESDKLLGFELGADDYLTKPFSVKELLARSQALLKRTKRGNRSVGPEEDEFTVGEAEIHFKRFSLIRGGREFPLSPKECEILKFLVRHPGEVIDRNRLIDEIWGDDYFPSPRTIDNFILKLRGKIEPDARNPRHLLTVHGAGYKLCL